MSSYYDPIGEALLAISNDLWDPAAMNPEECYEFATTLIFSGAEMQVANILHKAAQNYQRERSIIKYAYVADKLLKLPSFNEALQPMIVDLYCMIFLSLWSQRSYSQVEELKKLRKYWLAVLHPELLNQMRNNIFHWIQIDIDTGFRPQIVLTIRNFYERKLFMRPEEVSLYLPRQGNFQFPPLISPHPLYEVSENKIVNKPEPKRYRKMTDQETKIYDNQAICMPTKKVHIDPMYQKKAKCSKILKFMRENFNYVCRFCGLSVSSNEILEKHVEVHILESLNEVGKSIKKKQKQKLETTQEGWILLNQKDRYKTQTPFISISQFTKYKCALCNSEFFKDFINDNWVLQEAIQVRSQEQIQFMHKCCYQSLKIDD